MFCYNAFAFFLKNEIQEDHPEEVVVANKAPPSISQDNNEVQIITKTVTTKPRQTTANLPAKRQRISSPPRERPTSVGAKADVIPIQAPQTATDHLIQFKMEPFEADHSNQGQVDVYEDNPDDTFAEDGIEESQMEDSEYNNVMKGEEEPQAGTSGDALGENQGMWSFILCKTMHKMYISLKKPDFGTNFDEIFLLLPRVFKIFPLSRVNSRKHEILKLLLILKSR